MANFIKRIDLIDLTDFPQYLLVTDNIYLFNKAVTILKPNVIIYEGHYGVKVARADYKDLRVGVAIYGYGHNNAIWFLKEALQKGVRAFIKLGFAVNFGEETNPIIANYAIPCNTRLPYMLSIGSVELLTIANYIMESNGISHSVEPVISMGLPTDFIEEKELAEIRRKYNIRILDSDTAFIYDFANRWKAKSLSFLMPFIWSDTLADIGAWFNYEPSTKEESEATTVIVRSALDIFIEFNTKCEILRKGRHISE